MIDVIDLFAGCGGFSCGFEKAGFNIKSAVEFDPKIALSYKLNHPQTNVIADDIKNVDNNNVFKNNDAKVIIGRPPCQGFSMAGARIRKGFVDDSRNYLFEHYFNVVKIVRPQIFIIENVKGILNMNNGEIFSKIKYIFENPNNFEGKPYKIQYKVMKAKEYGIPQNRERTIIIGSLINFNLDEEIKKTKEYISNEDKHFFDNVSVWQAISNLPEPTEDGNIKIKSHENYYQQYLSSSTNNTYNHVKTKHNNIALNRMKKVGINENFTVLDEEINAVHSGSYGRLDPYGIAPTITTRFDTPSGGRYIHPFLDRTITPREAARLQSFPDDFKFIGTKSSICKQIGNAVPPKLSYFIGIMIRRILNT